MLTENIEKHQLPFNVRTANKTQWNYIRYETPKKHDDVNGTSVDEEEYLRQIDKVAEKKT